MSWTFLYTAYVTPENRHVTVRHRFATPWECIGLMSYESFLNLAPVPLGEAHELTNITSEPYFTRDGRTVADSLADGGTWSFRSCCCCCGRFMEGNQTFTWPNCLAHDTQQFRWLTVGIGKSREAFFPGIKYAWDSEINAACRRRREVATSAQDRTKVNIHPRVELEVAAQQEWWLVFKSFAELR